MRAISNPFNLETRLCSLDTALVVHGELVSSSGRNCDVKYAPANSRYSTAWLLLRHCQLICKPGITIFHLIILTSWEIGLCSFDTAQSPLNCEAFLGTAFAESRISQQFKVISKLYAHTNLFAICHLVSLGGKP